MPWPEERQRQSSGDVCALKSSASAGDLVRHTAAWKEVRVWHDVCNGLGPPTREACGGLIDCSGNFHDPATPPRQARAQRSIAPSCTVHYSTAPHNSRAKARRQLFQVRSGQDSIPLGPQEHSSSSGPHPPPSIHLSIPPRATLVSCLASHQSIASHVTHHSATPASVLVVSFLATFNGGQGPAGSAHL